MWQNTFVQNFFNLSSIGIFYSMFYKFIKLQQTEIYLYGLQQQMKKHIIPIIILTILLTTLTLAQQKVQQLNPAKLQASIKNNKFTFVYFYSTSCQYCQLFSPKFDQLAKINKIEGLVFGKIDGPAYTDVIQKYGVHSYPSVLLFWQDIDEPIFFRKQREVAKALEFLKSHTQLLPHKITKQKYQKLSEQQKNMGVLYIGPVPAPQINVISVLSFLQPFLPFAMMDANVSQPYLQIKGKQYYDFDVKKMRRQIRTAFARVHEIDEQAWSGIIQRKQIGIVFLDTKNNNKVVDIMHKLAPQMSDLIFMRLDPSQEQYREAINALGLENQQNLFAADEKYKVRFIAPRPYTEQSIRVFIQKVRNQTAEVYLRSQKTNHKQKLTRDNYEEKVMKDPKDVVIFLYRDEDRLQAKFMDLFKFLTNKLKDNKNISLLRCNLSKNQIEQKLGFPVKITPSIVFYAHRMKENPVHFLKNTISAENVIQFIMENTTFDWEDEWTEL